jgi:hypothetical protein
MASFGTQKFLKFDVAASFMNIAWLCYGKAEASFPSFGVGGWLKVDRAACDESLQVWLVSS